MLKTGELTKYKPARVQSIHHYRGLYHKKCFISLMSDLLGNVCHVLLFLYFLTINIDKAFDSLGLRVTTIFLFPFLLQILLDSFMRGGGLQVFMSLYSDDFLGLSSRT